MTRSLEQHVRNAVHLTGLWIQAPDVDWVPNTDIYETDSALVVRMEIAGVARDDIQLSLSGRLLVVRGSRREHHRTSHCSFRQMEIHYGTFERCITLSVGVDAAHARARYYEGFLVIELPKVSGREHPTVKVMLEME